MNEPAATEIKTKAVLQKRFRRALLLLYLLSLVVGLSLVYGFAKHEARNVADRELTLLVDMVKSLREYIAKDVRPGLLSREVLHPPAVSSTVATALVAKHFKEKQPDFYIKVAADHPLNPANTPQPLEWRLLERFRADRKLESLVETGELDGRMYRVSSRPAVAGESCLACHGDPYEAPAVITDTYGTDSGFFWKPGDVVGITVVGVPLVSVEEAALRPGLIVAGGVTLLFAVVLLIVGLLIRRNILAPVARMTQMAMDVSNGKLDKAIDVKRDGSEIGELGYAFEMLRRSLVAAMQRLRARRDS
jgi:HAMP domain-containing protein